MERTIEIAFKIIWESIQNDSGTDSDTPYDIIPSSDNQPLALRLKSHDRVHILTARIKTLKEILGVKLNSRFFSKSGAAAYK